MIATDDFWKLASHKALIIQNLKSKILLGYYFCAIWHFRQRMAKEMKATYKLYKESR